MFQDTLRVMVMKNIGPLEHAVSVKDVEVFWDNNPLCAAAIPHAPGTREFFECHNALRRKEEPEVFQRQIYEHDKWAGRDVLDIGCGIGYVVALYAAGGARVTGVDIAARSVELTRDRLRVFGLDADIRKADAEALPFADESFDLVTSFGVLHHTPNTQTAIREAIRVLRPGGRVILMFYHRNSFAYRVLFPLKRILQPSNWGKSADQQVNQVDGPANPLGKVYSRKELRAMLAGIGDLEFATGCTFFHHEDKLPRSIQKIIESHFGWFLYVKGNKPLRA
jgi:SAM-dependent methyltransferase